MFAEPSARQDVAPLITAAPPPLAASTDASETPRFLTAVQHVAPGPRAETLIADADWHFEAGRKLYEQRDQAGARREFDRAIDILLAAPEGSNARAALDRKLDQLVDVIHRLDLAGLGSGDIESGPVFEKPPLEDIPELTFPVDPKLKNKVAEELRATVSQLPLQLNDTILSYIDYFSTDRGRKILISGLRRSGRYRPLIQRVFDEEGVPQELIYMAQVESGFLPRAVSRKKATGMWQFMLERGREYGLRQTPYMDERLDPEKSTRAAARHLRDLYHRYGDWYLAIAAYNCGPGVIDKAVERTGYADFWELRRRRTMPGDTTSYVPVILAMTIMVKNAREYGLEDLEIDPPLEYDTLHISALTHLQLIADLTECPVSQLRDLNPALLTNLAPAGEELRIPKGSAGSTGELAELLDSVPADKRVSWRAHRVAAGESLDAIARRYHVTETAIASVNRDALRTLERGDLLLIPAAPEKAASVRASRKGKSRHITAAKHSAAKKGIRAAAPRHRAKTVAVASRARRSAIKR
ncbi:MAG: transglycosylase SLT domain-containing protein [Acidobacteriota bacterium]